MEAARTYLGERTLADRVNARLGEIPCHKAELALHLGLSRSLVSRYLNGTYDSDPGKVEAALEGWLAEVGEAVPQGQAVPVAQGPGPAGIPEKTDFFESRDAVGVIGVCNACQQNRSLGMVVGKSGFGKTHSLQKYAGLPRVAYIECNEAMNSKDLIRRIERSVGMPKADGSIDERIGKVIHFFNTNVGYLLIVDEADKLISKYTQKKLEMLRYITDGSVGRLGMVIAGEPGLESLVRTYDRRFANRLEFYYRLQGLSGGELEKYFAGYDVEPGAMEELVIRATNKHTGCFRLLDRTLNNVLRILRENGTGGRITMKVINEASNMMML